MNYIEAVCGAGKTEAAISHVIRRYKMFEDKFVIMMPTVQLIEQTATRLGELGYGGDITVIYKENGSGSVASRIHDFFNNPEASGVLLISVAAWKWIKGRSLEDWYLLVDECPQIFHVSSIVSKIVKEPLLRHLDVLPIEGSSYSSVTIREGSRAAIKNLWNDSHTDVALACLKETAENLHLGTKTYVNTDNYNNYSGGKASSITFYHVTPKTIFNGFKSVTILGANFTQSELYRLWSSWGIHFRRALAFRGQPVMPTTHPEAIGEALDIYYLCDEFSSSLKAKHTKILEEEFRRAVKEIFEDDEFIYTLNSSDDPRLLAGFGNGVYVNPKAHGQNDYRHIHCAAIYAHFNLSADQVAFLIWRFQLEQKTLWDLRNHDIYYQFVCRTSLREMPSAGSIIPPKKIIVMDRDMAFWLQKSFPGSRVHKFESDLIAALPVPVANRPKGSSVRSGAERTKKSRDKKKSLEDHKKLAILKVQWTSRTQKSRRNGNDNTLIGISVTSLYEKERWPLSSLGSLYSKDLKTKYFDRFDDVVGLLREAFERRLSDKNCNSLFNVTCFVPEEEKPRGRKLTDVAYSRAILLDMDSDKNCCPLEFASVLSGVEMVIHSTFSSTPNRRRWRVVIPLSRSVSRKEYHSIAADLIRLADGIGFAFDKTKQQANDFMYLPCQSGDKAASFFYHYSEETRSFLDADAWLGREVKGQKQEATNSFTSEIAEGMA